MKDIHNKDYSVVKTSKVACGLSGVHVAFYTAMQEVVSILLALAELALYIYLLIAVCAF